MVDKISPELRSWNMSQIRSRDTKPELKLRSLLHCSGFRFRVNDKTLPGRPDIVLKKYKTVILVHGCFWHRHPNCPAATTPSTRTSFWQNKFEKTIERDQLVKKTLSEMGWNVLIVWECELKNDAHTVLESVSSELRHNYERLLLTGY